MGFIRVILTFGSRIIHQARKEILQIVRRPAAFVSLVLGPFLLMALFGLGYTGVRSPLATTLVLPGEVDLPRDTAYYQELTGPAMEIRAVTDDLDAARAQLAAEEVGLVVAVPADATQALREGRQAEIQVIFDEIDPALDTYARVIAHNLSVEVNKEIIRRAVQEGEAYAMTRLEDVAELQTIPPEVIAEPTIATTSNVAQSQPDLVHFFAPAILALVLQHMAVTLSALSFVRERLSGTLELYRISPITSGELLLGKVVGFGAVSAVMAAAVVALVVLGLGVPMLGNPLALVAIVTLLVISSLSLGLLISVVSDSERQAVQLALLVLLASVFFSGIVLPIQDFRPALQAVSAMLPVTHGIVLLQELMLRGEWQIGRSVIILAVEALLLLIVTTLLLRRQMRSGVRG
jgi:ABC-2 type transport system permease protein